MKKSGIIIASLFLFIAFVGCNEKSKSKDDIIIVANVTLSTGSGFEKYGEQVWNGLALLRDTLASHHVQLKHQNNQGSEATTIQNFSRWIGREDVPIVITNNSPLSKNARTIAEENKINQIALVAGDIDFCDGYQWALRDAIMQNQEGEVLAPVVLRQSGLKTIVMLGVNDDYGTDGMKYLEQELLKANNDINIIKSTFDKSTIDFSSIIDSQLASKPDAIYFAGRDKAIVRYVNTLKDKLRRKRTDSTIRISLVKSALDQLTTDCSNNIDRWLAGKPEIINLTGLDKAIVRYVNTLKDEPELKQTDIPIYICDAFDDKDVWDQLGSNAKGIVFASYYNNFDNPEGQAFLKQYREAYGKDPGIYAVDAYVCGQYILKLVSEGNRTAESFNKAFETMTFDSPIKGYLYVNNHSVVSSVATYVINEQGEKELIYKPDVNIETE